MLQLLLVAVIIGSLIFMLVKKGKDQGGELANHATENSNGQTNNASINTHATQANDSAITNGGDALPSPTTFDPNTADSATLVSVGLSPRQAQNVIKYRKKGGQYHRPDDFKRLYGLTVGQWEHIEPLIRIGKQYQYLADNEDVYANRPNQSAPGVNNAQTNGNGSKGKTWSETKDSAQRLHNTAPFYSGTRIPKIKAGEHINLATADTIALQHIPGIGPYYARRIHEYGERLGGFVSVDQLNDEALDFLPMGIEQYLIVNNANVRKLHINKSTTRELSRHPYLTYAQAKQITERVRLYGEIKTWQELLFLSEFSEKDKARLEPYISFD